MDIATKCQTHKAQRLIDVNALKEAWKDVAVDGATLSYIYGLFKSVDDAPTIDAVPEVAIQKAWEQGKKDAVRHGKWLEAREKDPCQYICSECKWFVDDDSKYCPNCGAKMDGERSEE